MRKPTKSSLTNKIDKLCSQIVRARGYCEKCNTTNKTTLQCCHIFSRSYRSTRFYLPNLLCMCASCHFFCHKNPILFTEFVKSHLGEIEYELLKSIAIPVSKFTTSDLEHIYEELQKIEVPQLRR